MLISIIIPVYNTPINDFQKCLSSILEQKYSEIEIIIIDDGSDKELSKLYVTLCSKDKRVSYHYFTNHGVSYARNRGVEIAQGEYVTFVDSDDVIDQSFFVNAAKYLLEEKYDLVIGRIVYLPKFDSKQRIYKNHKEISTLRMLEAMFSVENKGDELHALASPCGRLYLTSIAKSIKFDECIKYFEDQLYNCEYVKKIKNALFVAEDWYYYYQNPYSALHVKHRKWDELSDWDVFLDRWIAINENESDTSTDILLKKHLITYFFKEIEEGVLAGEKFNRKKIRNIMNKKPFVLMTKSLKTKDYISKKRKLQFFLIKHRFSCVIYILAKIKNRRS